VITTEMMNVPREAMRTLSEDGTTQIETDGRTLWVNSPICVGRFSPFGYEVQKGEDQHPIASIEPDFSAFTEELKKAYGIDVEQYRSSLPWLP
jgi:hypothetical protein